MLCGPVEAGTHRPIVAVFEIADRTGSFDAKTRGELSDYLTTRMAAGSVFQVVPRRQVAERLRQQKRASYRACYDEKCQIEIGRELAAEMSLSTRIVKLGSACAVMLNLYDLKKGTAERSATQRAACNQDALIKALDQATDAIKKSSPPSSIATPSTAPATKQPNVGTEAQERLALKLRTYKERRIWFKGAAKVPHRGSPGDRLSLGAYFDLIGRTDLAASHRRRSILAWSIAGVSLAAVTAGLILFLNKDYSVGADNTASDVGIGLMIGGGVVSIAGVLIPVSPISATEAQQLAKTHNDNLRRELGLGVRDVLKISRTEPSVTLAPLVAGGQYGLGIAGRF